MKQLEHLSSAFGAAHLPPAALASLGEETGERETGSQGLGVVIMGTKLSLWYQNPSANGIPPLRAASLRCDQPQGTTEGCSHLRDAPTPGMLLPEGCCLQLFPQPCGFCPGI